MDNDPSQRSKVPSNTLKDVEAERLEIPARSPDVDSIESVSPPEMVCSRRSNSLQYYKRIFL